MDRDSAVPGQSFADLRVDLKAGPLSPWLRHAHRWTFDPPDPRDRGELRRSKDFLLMLQLEGDAWIWWGPARGSVALPPGSLAFIPPGVEHAHSRRLGSHFAVHFDFVAQPRIRSPDMLMPSGPLVQPRALGGMPAFRLHRPGLGEDLRFSLVTRVEHLAGWIERFDRLSFHYRTRSHRTLAAAIEADEILMWAVRTLSHGGKATSAPTTPSERAVAIVSQSEEDGVGGRSLPLAELARKAGMGRTAFWTSFVAATGMSPHAYIETRRMETAARLLVETRRAIADIAAEVGYADPFHFSRVFRRVIGLSPRAYRRSGDRPPIRDHA